MRSLRRMPAAIAISACARSPALGGGLEGGARRLDRIAGPAELEQQPAARHQQGEARLLRDGEREAALDQRERRARGGTARRARRSASRYAAAARGSSARSKCSAASTPSRVANHSAARACSGAPPLVQQRCVGAVADERMAEHELAAVGADEEVLDQQARLS